LEEAAGERPNDLQEIIDLVLLVIVKVLVIHLFTLLHVHRHQPIITV
jgi:hypothetical protein